MTFVYVIGARPEGPHKIGMSIDPAARLKALQAGSGHALSVVMSWECADARRVEMWAHHMLAVHASGREWFAVSDQQAIAAVRQAMTMAGKPRREQKAKRRRPELSIDLNAEWAAEVAKHGEPTMRAMVTGLGQGVAAWRAENDKWFPGGVPPIVHDPETNEVTGK